MTIYQMAKNFKAKYPGTVAWRLKQNSSVVQKHLNPGEEVKYVFVGQKNDNPFDIVTTAVVAITNKRILIGSKRVVFGYFLTSITPDMFNDLKVVTRIFWGTVIIDTIKELVYISNISKDALPEIETNVTEYIMEEKKKYVKKDNKEN